MKRRPSQAVMDEAARRLGAPNAEAFIAIAAPSMMCAFNLICKLIARHEPPEGQPERSAPVVIVRILPTGNAQYLAFDGPPVRLFIVDECAPGDRVYEITDRHPAPMLHALVRPGEPIGSQHDERHQALMSRVEAARNGTPNLRSVE